MQRPAAPPRAPPSPELGTPAPGNAPCALLSTLCARRGPSARAQIAALHDTGTYAGKLHLRRMCHQASIHFMSCLRTNIDFTKLAWDSLVGCSEIVTPRSPLHDKAASTSEKLSHDFRLTCLRSVPHFDRTRVSALFESCMPVNVKASLSGRPICLQTRVLLMPLHPQEDLVPWCTTTRPKLNPLLPARFQLQL